MLRAFSAWVVGIGLAAFFAASASATQARYTFSGVLATRAGQSDLFGMEGASYSIAVDVDSDVRIPPGPFEFPNAYLCAVTPEIRFSNRPDGLPDFVAHAGGSVGVINGFPPGGVQDTVYLEAGMQLAVPGVAPTLWTGRWLVTFPDQSYFPGSGEPPLPVFEAADVASLVADALNYPVLVPPHFLLSPIYDVLEPTVTAQPIPEPSTLVLMLSGTLGFAVRRRLDPARWSAGALPRTRSAPSRRRRGTTPRA
jgi:hypothetical protein